jgi:hypothetical protein
MKKTLLLLSLIGGLASTNAATSYPIETSDNNLFLGFFSHSDVGTKSVLINLGTSADVFKGFTLDLSATNSALSTAFEKLGQPRWFDNSQVYWGLIGYDSSALTNTYDGIDEVSQIPGSAYASRSSGSGLLPTGNGSTLGEEGYYSLQGAAAGLIPAYQDLNGAFSTIVGSTGNTNGISVQNNNGSTTFKEVAERNYDGAFTVNPIGLVTSGLNIQQFTVDPNNAASWPTAFSGTFGVITQAGGVITVVPEPTTYALFGLGALMLVVAYRRKVS